MLMAFDAAEVTVNAYKPSVFGSADGPGVEITRDRGSVSRRAYYGDNTTIKPSQS
jgi:hypothetical protein